MGNPWQISHFFSKHQNITSANNEHRTTKIEHRITNIETKKVHPDSVVNFQMDFDSVVEASDYSFYYS